MPYIGKSTDGFGIRERFTYVVSAGATSISGADANGRTLTFEDPEYVDVFLNGVRLKKDTDYNLNTANTISSLAALVADDEVEVIVNDVFTLADMVSANNGGDFRGNLAIAKDSGVLSFGLDKEITLIHSADAGLILKHANTADDSFPNLLLQTGDTDIAINDVLGSIQFQAPDEGTGTDAILVGAAIQAISEGDFSSSNNATKLSFQTGASEAAAEKMSLSSAGVLTVSSNIVSSGTITGGGLLTTGGSIVIPDDGNIGSASDTNAIAISSAGVVTISTNTDATNSTSGALVAHSAGFADDVYVGDGLFVTGAITGSGAVQGTTITATTAFVPDASDGAALGSASLEFSDLFLADAAVINFGADQDINITHVADTGLTTNGSFTASGTMQGTTITATTAFVPDASDGAALGTSSLEFSDLFLADGGEVKFGADQDVLLRHDHNSGLIIDRTNTSDNSPTTLTLQTAETDIQADDVIGTINFQAPDEGTGTDAILVAAGIDAVSEGDFSSSNNATKLVFKTAASEAASSKATLSSTGVFTATSFAGSGSGLTAGTTPITTLDIDGATDIGAAVVDADLFIIDDGAGGTNRKVTASRIKTYTNAGVSSAADDISAGDAAVNITTSSGNITIDAAANDSDIIFKGTDNSSDITMLTLDGSEAGAATFNNKIIATELDISGDIDVDGTTNLDVVDIDGAVDMASTLQVDGSITTSSAMSITTAGNTTTLDLISTDADANSGPQLDFYRNSSSPADNDYLGRIKFIGRNDNNQDFDGTDIIVRSIDVSDGTEDTQLTLYTMANGAQQLAVAFNAAETVFNEDSVDIDFRVESNGNANMLFVDGGNDQVRIGSTEVLANTGLRVEGAIKSSHNNGTPNTNGFNQFTDAAANTYNTHFRNYSSSPAAQYILDVSFASASPDNGTAKFVDFRDSTTSRCHIASDGDIDNHDNSYSGFSDEKLKEQIKDASSQWEDVKALTVRKFKFKTDVSTGDSDDHWRLGVIAQEVELAGMNGLVRNNADTTANSDGIISETGTITKSVKYSILYMKAVKALQEAMARIETLEASNTALEARITALEDA